MDGTNGPKESTRATASVASNALSVGQPVPNDTKVIARYLFRCLAVPRAVASRKGFQESAMAGISNLPVNCRSATEQRPEHIFFIREIRMSGCVRPVQLPAFGGEENEQVQQHHRNCRQYSGGKGQSAGPSGREPLCEGRGVQPSRLGEGPARPGRN